MGSQYELSTADVARIQAKSRIQAWRWLKDLEAKHGTAAVHRRGRCLFTTWAALERYTSHKRPLEETIRKDLRIQSERIFVTEKRVDGLAREVSTLRAEVAKVRKPTYAHLFEEKE